MTKNQQAMIEQARAAAEEAQQTLENLIANVNAEDNWPQEGDNVYFLEWAGAVSLLKFRHDEPVYRRALAQGSLYKTQSDAIDEGYRRELEVKMRAKVKELNGDWVPDWLDYTKTKATATIYYVCNEGKFKTEGWRSCHYPMGWLQLKGHSEAKEFLASFTTKELKAVLLEIFE